MEISAPGKLIISGEHSVVYGKNALCASIDLRCRCFGYVNASHHGRITFQLKDLNQQVVVDGNSISRIATDKEASESYASFLAVVKEAASAETLYTYKVLKALVIASSYFQEEDLMNIRQRLSAEDYTFLVDSSIPVGKGLGSSAATSVCVAAALLCLFERLVNKNLSTRASLVNDIAFQYERVYHSNPSGVDNFVSVNGGLVIFNRNSTEMKKLNWPFSNLNILLIDSQIEKNTKKAVEHVRYLYDHENGKPLIEEIAAVTDSIIRSI